MAFLALLSLVVGLYLLRHPVYTVLIVALVLGIYGSSRAYYNSSPPSATRRCRAAAGGSPAGFSASSLAPSCSFIPASPCSPWQSCSGSDWSSTA
jgi:hypothetical protein